MTFERENRTSEGFIIVEIRFKNDDHREFRKFGYEWTERDLTGFCTIEVEHGDLKDVYGNTPDDIENDVMRAVENDVDFDGCQCDELVMKPRETGPLKSYKFVYNHNELLTSVVTTDGDLTQAFTIAESIYDRKIVSHVGVSEITKF